MEEKIMHLLITEDDMALAQGLQRALQEKNRQVLCCKNIQETRQHLHQNQTDLLILDVNLPDGSGFDLLQEIRRTSDLPVILLTANDLEMDIVSGLEQGANDYITKPFSLAVLRARVNTQLRNRTVQMQKESTQNTQIWEGSIWKLDFTNMRFTVSGQEVELSKTEQKLLALLVQHAGMTVPRETLMDRIWTVARCTWMKTRFRLPSSGCGINYRQRSRSGPCMGSDMYGKYDRIFCNYIACGRECACSSTFLQTPAETGDEWTFRYA